MNKKQKEVLQSQLNDEENIIRELKQVYKKANDDVVEKIKALEARTDVENLQSIVYQKQYQQALKTQLDAILDVMNGNQFDKISDYLSKCYESGFVGAVYDLHGQKIPLIMPIDQEQVVKAIQTDSKISEGLYKKLGVNTKELKDSIRANVSRGIAASTPWSDVARNIDNRMKIGMNKSLRIARTEGHRISNEAAYNAQIKAKDKGADIVKQWDATLDSRTRPSHARIDGEIKELEEKFSNGLRYPGDSSGAAAEVVNCRCAVLQRAKWALDEDELKTLQERAEYFGLDKTENFEDFKTKYLQTIDKNGKDSYNGSVIIEPKKGTDEKYNELLDVLKQTSVEYNPVADINGVRSGEEIIAALSGGDLTQGSCASLGLAYIGQRQGLNVLDFRDGESRRFFSMSSNLLKLSNANGISVIRETGASSITVGNRLLKHCEVGKEYYLCVGRHAAIVRKTEDDILQYLELQSSNNSGWHNFNRNPRYTLKTRFGCSTTSGSSAYYDFMIDIDDSDFETDDFRTLLGYINTSVDKQRKGGNGTIK